MNLETLKFPIGQFEFNPDVSNKDFENWILILKKFPSKIKDITKNLSVEKLNWKYRPNGWSIKQVVHHCADSHMNSFIRFKLALTEENPTIRPYEEHLWAELEDSISDDLSSSIQILEGVHNRWSLLIDTLQESDWEKNYFHPSSQKLFPLKEVIALYAWHCEHHFAHIVQALKYEASF